MGPAPSRVASVLRKPLTVSFYRQRARTPVLHCDADVPVRALCNADVHVRTLCNADVPVRTLLIIDPGGLQSLAAAGDEHCPQRGFPEPRDRRPPRAASGLRKALTVSFYRQRARTPVLHCDTDVPVRALCNADVPVRALLIIDLEGCGPLQPRG